MKINSLLQSIDYSSTKPLINVLFETENTKEIRIILSKDVSMKKHQTPFPITVEIFEGKIDFGVDEKQHVLKKGDIVSLEGNVPHDLVAKENSIVRLTLAKSDSVERVQKVVD